MVDSDVDDRSDDPRPPTGVGSIFGFLMWAPVLYLLSIGPIVRLVEDGYLPRDPVAAAYAPVSWLHENTPLAKPLEWYAALWGWY